MWGLNPTRFYIINLYEKTIQLFYKMLVVLLRCQFCGLYTPVKSGKSQYDLYSVGVTWNPKLTRNVCETCMLPNLKCHCDLDLCPRNPKFNRGHLLVMNKHHTKLEDPWVMSSLVIARTRFVYGPTDVPTDRTTSAKQYTPHFFEGGIIIDNIERDLRCNEVYNVSRMR